MNNTNISRFSVRHWTSVRAKKYQPYKYEAHKNVINQ